ncbi:ribosome production factor 2 homolog [Strongylocentrotus purpuratus]|uniref:Ribosome production factor 2 homolog n=1 Tax=Strongylocentrotus purpuratus TaxID=7668 RepID=A0A7M7PFW6_STRPU|nr:ribosome production factor 2 homolog [Strongylocentrotus purpuratus]
MQRIVKPKNQRVKRALEKRDPKLVENTKTSLMIRGGHTSEKITALLTELHMLRKPHSQMLKRKNIMRPFEDQTSLEFMSQKNDASLFAFGSHSKKRPHNLVFGRMFEHHTLDMIELGVENFKSMHAFKTSKCTSGTKPCLMFTGELFDSDHIHKKLKNLLIDFFRGPVVDAVRLGGMECVLSFTAVDEKILMRSYKVILKKSGSRTPRVELTEIGPSLDLVVRRTRLATQDLFKRASKKPKALKAKKKKNISHDVFKTMHGRVHMEKQDLAKLQIRKVKALKKTKEETKDGKTEGGKTEDGQSGVKKRRSLRSKGQTQDGQSQAKKKRKE